MTLSSSKRASIARRLKKAASLSNRVHVLPQTGKWSVRIQGTSKASKIFGTKNEAISCAKDLARSQPATAILVHNKDGKIAEHLTIRTTNIKIKGSTGKTGSAKK